MKKLLTLSMIALLSTPAFANPDVYINVSGQVVKSTCTVVGNKFSGTGATLAPTQLTTKDGITTVGSETQNLVVKLENCDAKTPVRLTFDSSDTYVTSEGYIKNAARDNVKADHVHIKLLKDGTPFNLKSDSLPLISPTEGKADFNFTIQYAVESGKTPTAGTVVGRVPATIAYQ